MATTRRKGGLPLDNSVELSAKVPLDARSMVRSKEELLDAGSFADNGYKGMLTIERTEGKAYVLMDNTAHTAEESWQLIGPYDDSELRGRIEAIEQGGTGGTPYDDTAIQARVAALEAKTETQADWNETNVESAAYIANKPTIPSAYDDAELAARVAALEDISALTDEEIAALVPA